MTWIKPNSHYLYLCPNFSASLGHSTLTQIPRWAPFLERSQLSSLLWAAHHNSRKPSLISRSWVGCPSSAFPEVLVMLRSLRRPHGINLHVSVSPSMSQSPCFHLIIPWCLAQCSAGHRAQLMLVEWINKSTRTKPHASLFPHFAPLWSPINK